jgi:O-antigen ligase
MGDVFEKAGPGAHYRNGTTLAYVCAQSAGVLIVLGSGLSAAFNMPLARSLFALLLLFTFVAQSVFSKHSARMPGSTLPALGLLLIMILGLLYTRAPVYGIAKVAYFTLFWVGVPIALFGVFASVREVGGLLSGAALGGLLYGVLLLVKAGSPFSLLSSADAYFRFALGSQNPIYLGRVMGLSVVVLLWVVVEPRFGWRRLVAAAATPWLVGYLAATASKGPVFGFLASVVVFAVMARGRVGITALVLIAVLLTVLVIAPLPFQDETRLENLRLVRTTALSFEERGASWSAAVGGVERGGLFGILLGAGTGSYAHLARGDDVRHYPHNVFLEILYENGIAGALLLLLLIAFPFASLTRAWPSARSSPPGRRLLAVACSLYVFALVNAQVTGDLISNEWIPLTGAVLAFVGLKAANPAGAERDPARRFGGAVASEVSA